MRYIIFVANLLVSLNTFAAEPLRDLAGESAQRQYTQNLQVAQGIFKHAAIILPALDLIRTIVKVGQGEGSFNETLVFTTGSEDDPTRYALPTLALLPVVAYWLCSGLLWRESKSVKAQRTTLQPLALTYKQWTERNAFATTNVSGVLSLFARVQNEEDRFCWQGESGDAMIAASGFLSPLIRPFKRINNIKWVIDPDIDEYAPLEMNTTMASWRVAGVFSLLHYGITAVDGIRAWWKNSRKS